MLPRTGIASRASRVGYLDALRGLAIIWMIFFHFVFDLSTFGFIRLNFRVGFWHDLPVAITFVFLFCVGASLHYGHAEGFRKADFIKRSLKLLGAAALVSAGTAIAFPKAWVYFGTLHCILFGSLLGIWFVFHRKLAALLLTLILVCQFILGFNIKWVSENITRKYAVDFVPIYPWLWVILLGIILAPHLAGIRRLRTFQGPPFLKWLSDHSLKIYLLHQPILIASLWIVRNYVIQK